MRFSRGSTYDGSTQSATHSPAISTPWRPPLVMSTRESVHANPLTKVSVALSPECCWVSKRSLFLPGTSVTDRSGEMCDTTGLIAGTQRWKACLNAMAIYFPRRINTTARSLSDSWVIAWRVFGGSVYNRNTSGRPRGVRARSPLDATNPHPCAQQAGGLLQQRLPRDYHDDPFGLDVDLIAALSCARRCSRRGRQCRI